MAQNKVHLITHHNNGVRCCSVFDEATGVIVSNLTDEQAHHIVGKLSGETVFYDAQDAPELKAS